MVMGRGENVPDSPAAQPAVRLVMTTPAPETTPGAVAPALPPGTPESPVPLPLPKGVPLVGTDRIQFATWLKALFDGGMSVPDLTRVVGRDRNWVYLILGEAGVKFSRQHPIRRRPR